jgi:hypothetical protein
MSIRQRDRDRYRMRRHAATRAHERFGVSLRPEDLVAMRKRIEVGDPRAAFIRNARGRELWNVYMGDFPGGRDMWVTVVYDRPMNSVVTCLARECSGAAS